MATTLTLNHTGSVKTYRVADKVINGSVSFTIVGGGGGGGGADADGSGGNGSAGRVVTGTFAVNEGDIIEVAVGGGGQRGRTGGNGGAGGGSFDEYAGGDGANPGPVGASGGGGGGGGATVIKLNGRAIAIAGGGGGGGGGSWQRDASDSGFSEGGAGGPRGQNGGYLTGGTDAFSMAVLPWVRDGGGGGGGGGGKNGGAGGQAGTDHTSYTGGDGGQAGNRGSSFFSSTIVNGFSYTGSGDPQITGFVSNVYGYGGRGATAGSGGVNIITSKTYAKVSYPSAWSSFMNTYAIWEDGNFFAFNKTFASQSLEVEFPSGPVILRYAADNVASIRIDGTLVASTSSNFNTFTDVTVNVGPGKHTISWSVTNIGGGAGNPGGIAWALYRSGRTTPFWHSRRQHIIDIQYSQGTSQDNATSGQDGVAIMSFNLTPRDINVKTDESIWSRIQEVYVKKDGVWYPCEDVFVKKNKEWTKALYRGRFTVTFDNGSGWGTGGSPGPARELEAPRDTVVCISVIDEDDGFGGSRSDAWSNFRGRYPYRSFFLLRPRDSGVTTPANFKSDSNARGPIKVNRGSPASDWFSLCNLRSRQSGTIVSLWIDTSGSMKLSTVQSSYDLFIQKCNAAGITVVVSSGSGENWINPHIRDFG